VIIFFQLNIVAYKYFICFIKFVLFDLVHSFSYVYLLKVVISKYIFKNHDKKIYIYKVVFCIYILYFVA
jgi:hypothetical protein